MSIERPESSEQRLLPSALEDRLVGWLGRAGGMALLLALLAAWLSLATWTVSDPSLTHATGGAVRNALGWPGAVISDLMLQTLGLGALFALMAPMLWALELAASEKVAGARPKLTFYPIAVLVLAAGLSALPVASAWPFNHGYGGILGDAIYGLATSLLTPINADRAGLAAGLLLFAAGFAALSASIGVEVVDVIEAIGQRAERLRSRQDDPAIAGQRDPSDDAATRDGAADTYGSPDADGAHAAPEMSAGRLAAAMRRLLGRARPDAATHDPSAAAWHHQAQWQNGWPAQHPHAHPEAGAHHPHPGPETTAFAGHPDAGAYYAAVPYPATLGTADGMVWTGAGWAPHPMSGQPLRSVDPRLSIEPEALAGGPRPDAHIVPREPGFDAHTDAASRAIAERFAPGGRPAAPRGQPADGPALALANAPQTRFAVTGSQGQEQAFPHSHPTSRSHPTGTGHRAAPAQTHVPPYAVDHGPTGRPPQGGLLGGLGFRRPDASQYKRPSLNLLKRSVPAKAGTELTPAVLRGTARLLEDVLVDFGVKGEIKDIRPGPVVTLYEFEPARGTKSSRVIGLADDIARSMSATAVRVAIVPGRNAIGIELPNQRRETVLLREILDTETWRSADAALPVVLGKSIGGEPVTADLARMPHLLVAGTTGSGKSVGVNTLILSLLFRHTPDECRFLMIDPKMLELSVYNGIPHLLAPVVTDPSKAVAALNWAVREMEERYKRMAQLSVRNIEVFNNRVRNARKRGELISRTVQTGFDKRTGQAIFEKETLALEPMPYIVVVVDEFADLMVVAGKDIEATVQRLAQMARAAGIHLVMATQRPSVDIVTGTIKANFPTRISFKVASKIDSRTILNDQGAEQLLGQGDMLYLGSGGGQPVRVHGAFVADDEVEAIATYLRGQGVPRYVEGITDVEAKAEGGADQTAPVGEDDLFDRAVAIVVRDRKASTSYLQRRLSIGYNRAADLIERMEREGLISAANAVGKREILAGGISGADAA